VAHAIAPTAFHGNDARAALAGVAAAVVLVAVNHTLLAPMLRLGRGVTFKASGLFSVESLAGDIVLAGLGVAAQATQQVGSGGMPGVVRRQCNPVDLGQRDLGLEG